MDPNQPHQPPVAEMTLALNDLRAFALAYGLTESTVGRCSDRFLIELYMLPMLAGINPGCVIEEVGALECGDRSRRGTKKADRFRHPDLRGLWKKHFYAARFLRQNLARAWEGGRLERIIMTEMDPAKAPVGETDEERAFRQSHALAKRAGSDSFLERKERRELTGEWIIFAKHPTGNHYLTIAGHDEGDAAIRERIVTGVVPQFAFVGDLLGV